MPDDFSSWRPIPSDKIFGKENYFASETGGYIKNNKGYISKGTMEKGRARYTFSMSEAEDRKTKTFLVYHLVAFAFLPEPRTDQVQVNHIDGNPNNNDVSNLEWNSCTENLKHARATGLIKGLIQPLSMFDRNTGEKLMDFDSVKEAHEHIIGLGLTSTLSPDGIRTAARGIRPHAFGYFWKYQLEENGQVKKQRRK